MNKAILSGTLGKDPEVRTITSGKKVANFSLATNETRKDKNGEKVQETEWHNIVVWGTAAEIAEKYLKKGSKALIEGKIKNKSYEDKDGNKKYITEIHSERFEMLDGKRQDGQNDSSIQKPMITPLDHNEDEDLPF